MEKIDKLKIFKERYKKNKYLTDLLEKLEKKYGERAVYLIAGGNTAVTFLQYPDIKLPNNTLNQTISFTSSGGTWLLPVASATDIGSNYIVTFGNSGLVGQTTGYMGIVSTNNMSSGDITTKKSILFRIAYGTGFNGLVVNNGSVSLLSSTFAALPFATFVTFKQQGNQYFYKIDTGPYNDISSVCNAAFGNDTTRYTSMWAYTQVANTASFTTNIVATPLIV